MAYQVLARKWRPKIFDDVIAQDHVTQTLKNAIKNNKVAQAYLLTGTRGVGKTTIARIFAKSLMCQNKSDGVNPCLTCEACQAVENGTSIDYNEIDGASNNKVENIRDLIDNVQYLPTTGNYKIYVIDEVHMLTTNAFNALLKTLEEPPKHVVFIFATTDPQKLLGTVISRCQRLDLKNVESDILVMHLKKIAQSEGITFENDQVVNVLANLGNGSVRDTLSLLDQVLSLSENNLISEESLTLSVGLARISAIDNLILAILAMDKENAINFYKEVIQDNVNLKNFSLQMVEKLYYIVQNSDNSEVLNNYFNQDVVSDLLSSELLWIYETFLKEVDWALSSLVPTKAVELILLKLTLRRELLSGEKVSPRLVEYKKKSEKPSPELNQKESTLIEEKKEHRLDAVLDQSWLELVKFVTTKSQPLGINLEKGNLIGPLGKVSENYLVSIGYNEEAKIFFDYISAPENRRNLINYLAEFFNSDESAINLNLKFLSQEESQKLNFMSHSELAHKIEENIVEDKKNSILNNPYIKEAEKLFNAKISDVIVNEKE